MILGAVDKVAPPVNEEIMGPIRTRNRARWLAEEEPRRAKKKLRRDWQQAKAQLVWLLSRPSF